MQIMWPKFAFLCLNLMLLRRITGSHVCDPPFGNFVQCLNSKISSELNLIKNELSTSTQTKLIHCFSSISCPSPNFGQANVKYFVQDPLWQDRLSKLLGFIEGVNPKVRNCMIDHFVTVTLNGLERCAHSVGPEKIRDFHFPKMQLDVDVDFEQIKQVILNRMMVRMKLHECKQKRSGQTSKLVDCLQASKAVHARTDLCQTRQICKTQTVTNPYCSQRLDDVMKAICVCLEQAMKGARGVFKEQQTTALRDGILKGKIEEKFRQCHAMVGVPFPEQKMENMKKVFKDTVVDIILRKQVPDALKNAMRLVLDVFKDFGQEWSTMLCSTCDSTQQNIPTVDRESQQLRVLAQQTS
ncbi:hypothetical protein T4C_5797 [Trichinella pseudospiralis]|uniref:Uncharacterized protein n=3 Tax=Trichinella pseudospiralis TaxID=6337 RepID=A0A0V1JSQ2_TRIPS|nr:hypothetical protein T4C_5797 [Trichinella pseudospiralis]